MKFRFLALSLLITLLASCSGILPQNPAQGPQETPTEAVVAAPDETVVQTPAATATPSGPLILKIWVPPQFDPSADTAAGNLFEARLREFTQRRPNVRVEVRVKAVEGPGGLSDSLTTANAAAPLALPDLIALPRPVLETAALKGLLYPFEQAKASLEDANWYEYARQLAQVQNSIFGIPFAGDALLAVYRPNAVTSAPASWSEVLETPGSLVFPAADPQALFTFTLYQAAGGIVRDAEGRPVLDKEKLTQVLTFYADAEQREVMPYWLTQFQNDDLVWESFEENRADLVVTWASRYLNNLLADTAAAPVPTPDGADFTLATGWVWALARPQPERQEAAAELAEFLTDSAYLAKWSEAAGYLPTRRDVLDGWSDTSLQAVIGQVTRSAQLIPSADILNSLGLPLEQATIDVLKQQADPPVAADQAVSTANGP